MWVGPDTAGTALPCAVLAGDSPRARLGLITVIARQRLNQGSPAQLSGRTRLAPRFKRGFKGSGSPHILHLWSEELRDPPSMRSTNKGWNHVDGGDRSR